MQSQFFEVTAQHRFDVSIATVAITKLLVQTLGQQVNGVHYNSLVYDYAIIE